MPRLLLGPVLRHVGANDATIWVETDAGCSVEVRRGPSLASTRTFAVAGHHYALVVLEGLEPGTTAAYEVRLDGDVAWPSAEGGFPPSVLRTIDPSRPVRLVFGSCRSPGTVVVRDPTGSGEDVLVAFARRMALLPASDWPDALLMLGDQVYADDTSDASARAFARRRDVTRAPYTQVATFEEYTMLYREAWGEPTIRWLLSTVPSSMIFDDHDVIDDWNTSASWRREMQRTSWWQKRIVAALSSYWVYQHLGNLDPDALRHDPLYAEVQRLPDGEEPLRRFAVEADAAADRGGEGEPATRWSFRRDFGGTRVLFIDSRAGRILAGNRRAIVGDAEFAWIEAQVEDGPFDHLVIATSLPWLLPRALHDLESWDEALAAGRRGRALARGAEWLRRAVDLEHWAAFRESFDRLARLIVRVGTGAHGAPPPATISVISGDVHHTYVSEAHFPAPMESRVYQLTCSPFHNSIPLVMRLVFMAAWSRWAHRWSRWLARLGRVPDVGFGWETTAGPYFGNHLMQLTLDGRSAALALTKSALENGTTRAAPVADAARDLAPGPGGSVPVLVHATAAPW